MHRPRKRLVDDLSPAVFFFMNGNVETHALSASSLAQGTLFPKGSPAAFPASLEPHESVFLAITSSDLTTPLAFHLLDLIFP